ncbi:MAG: hypothetical protein HY700_06795 [Gemmatimonadetes bacterium]|nr:hypothetical protein [Gemmatimonadota bacterium]
MTGSGLHGIRWEGCWPRVADPWHLFCIAAVLLTPPLLAQQPRTCVVVLDEAGRQGRQTEVRPGVIHLFGSGGVVGHCKDESTNMQSDSVAWYQELDRVDFVGRVNFTDSSVVLNANRASYFLHDERLEAYGEVSLVNRVTGSRLTGPNLTYRRRIAALRDTADLYATNRPTVEYHGQSDTAGAEPYLIRGERIRLRGNSRAWAAGAVTIDRSDFSARADSASLDVDAGRGELLDHAQVEGHGDAKYQLSGRTIQYRMQDRQLTWVQARGRAEAVSDEWRLLADTVEFDIADRRIQGGRAWSDSTRARAVSVTYNILADSLAIDSPKQRLTQLRAFRHAHATSKSDSLRVESDWMEGDTLVAKFDTTALGQRILSQLSARGNARAFYHVTDPKQPNGPPGISYSRGLQIAARFTALGLDRVDVVGASDGVYLEPATAVPPRADSTRTPSPPSPPPSPGRA